MVQVLPSILAMILVSCSSAQEFNGGGAPAPEKDTTPVTKEKTTTEDTTAELPANLPDLQPPPRNVVTKGSFSAWTMPENPNPGQAYTITIEVKLPSNVSQYQRSDLSGMVIGTDGYQQSLSYDFFKNSQRFEQGIDMARLHVRVPGGANLVRDEIQIQSLLLNESQVLHLQFGHGNGTFQQASTTFESPIYNY